MKKYPTKIRNLLKNKDVIHCAVCLIILLIILAFRFILHNHLAEYIDVGMLTSVVTAFFLTTLATIIARAFSKVFEDVTKLTNDYNSLVKMYKANTEMLICQNEADSNYKKGRKTSCIRLPDNAGDTYEIPIGDVILLRGRNVVIHDYPDEQYTPPEFCQTHYSDLLNAHDFSTTYNQLTLRVKDIEETGGDVHISFSRSTYFDSLVSNRAIDFKIDGLCVRDIYAHGPYLTPLKTSKLSNHMGFNGMVETSDGIFVFVKRHGRVSIGKNTIQCSVSSSLKAKYTLNKTGQITKQGIEYAIAKEIEDELNLSKIENYARRKNEIFSDFSFDNNVLFFYRDLVEGGKPHFMFYAKINVHSSELKRAQKRKKRKISLLQDGYNMIFVDRNELKKIYLAPDEMIIYNKHYPAMPSAVGTVTMLKQAISQGLIRSDIQESFTLSKKGDQASNEDAIYAGERFIAIVDGVTAKSTPPPNAVMSSGKFAAQAICKQLAVMPNLTDPQEILKWLNDKLKNDIAASVFAECKEVPLASIILYDSLTHQIISYGDCQALLKNQVLKREKNVDKRLAEKRSLILQTQLNNGHNCEELLKNDIGRAAITEELLAHSTEYVNNPNNDGFPALGSGEIVADYIDVYSVENGESVVLASDGYPVLAETLIQSENQLEKIIKNDPLLIYQYKSTKGIAPGNVSYDDRSYIRLIVQ